MSIESAAGSRPDPPRELRMLDALMINVGTILGSAIFLVPASILASVQTPFMAIFTWVLAGLLSLFGALTFAELAVLFPRDGGEYVFLARAYHPFLGFLYGWTLFAVVQTASIAAVAVAFMTYLGYFIELSPVSLKAGAIVLILGLSVWNCYGMRTSANTQNSTTLLKLGFVLAIVISCFLYGGGGALAGQNWLPAGSSLSVLTALGTAMVAALWAYDGWISITFVGGEVRNPEQFIPRALSWSVLFLMLIYLLLNLSFMYALPMADLKSSERVASDAVQNVLGTAGGGLVAAAVIISCFAAVNGFIFTGARVYYAMARDGFLLSSMAKLGRRSRVPVQSLLAQGVWASLIALTGSYDQLFTYVVFGSWLFYALGAAAVIILRIRHPGQPRAYRVPGYPWVPLSFVILAAALLVNTLFTDPRDSLIGLGIMLAGVPIYLRRRRTT